MKMMDPFFTYRAYIVLVSLCVFVCVSVCVCLCVGGCVFRFFFNLFVCRQTKKQRTTHKIYIPFFFLKTRKVMYQFFWQVFLFHDQWQALIFYV